MELHPPLPNRSRTPDFLATSKQSGKFYLEAALATFQSEDEAAAQSRLNQVYDVLNRRIESDNFFLMVNVEHGPDSQPPGRKIVRLLNAKLRELDPDQLREIYESEGLYALPTWNYENEGWYIKFRPIPKTSEARGKAGVRPLGMFESGFQSVDHRTPLRATIEEKASAYGDLEYPFVIAVMPWSQ